MSFEFVRRLEGALAAPFVGREAEARALVLALLTRQHAVLIGEPGVAKTALIERLTTLVKARLFKYKMTTHTVPDELIGAIDPVAYREGRFVRMTKGKLPEAEIAFIDEVFKGSSETLNALLGIMNERVFVDVDGTVRQVPLWSLFGASNEVPSESDLAAFYDRFLIRHFVRRIDATLLEKAVVHNIKGEWSGEPVGSLEDVRRVYDEVTAFMRSNAEKIASVTARVVVTLREHGVFVSDRTAVSRDHLPRLVATLCLVYGYRLEQAAVEAARYVLPNAEAFEAYRKAVEAMVPSELREAWRYIEEARVKVSQGRLDEAKGLAVQALNSANLLLSKPEKAAMFKAELTDVISRAEKLVEEIEAAEKRLKSVLEK